MSEYYNYIGAICELSGNPCGTDTHPPEFPCQCAACRAVARVDQLEQQVQALRRGIDNIKIRSYELGQRELHDMALASLRKSLEEG